MVNAVSPLDRTIASPCEMGKTSWILDLDRSTVITDGQMTPDYGEGAPTVHSDGDIARVTIEDGPLLLTLSDAPEADHYALHVTELDVLQAHGAPLSAHIAGRVFQHNAHTGRFRVGELTGIEVDLDDRRGTLVMTISSRDGYAATLSYHTSHAAPVLKIDVSA